jgi:hypothetical protein
MNENIFTDQWSLAGLQQGLPLFALNSGWLIMPATALLECRGWFDCYRKYDWHPFGILTFDFLSYRAFFAGASTSPTSTRRTAVFGCGCARKAENATRCASPQP